jgi:hypothetical protein
LEFHQRLGVGISDHGAGHELEAAGFDGVGKTPVDLEAFHDWIVKVDQAFKNLTLG